MMLRSDIKTHHKYYVFAVVVYDYVQRTIRGKLHEQFFNELTSQPEKVRSL